MRAIVTGAAGFIGTRLVARLLAEGAEVRGIDSLTDYYDPARKRANLERNAHPAFDVVVADLVGADLPALVDGADVVFHLAGQPGVRGSWGTEFGAYTHANIDATQRLLEAVAAAECRPRIVYASSSSVYGQAEHYPTSEFTLPRPHSPYGVTKLAGEHLVGLYRANHGLDTVSFRFFTVYGPGQRPDMAFQKFFEAIAAGRELPVYGDGTQIRDFTFVDDIVDALVRAAHADAELPGVMNLAGGSSISLREVIDTIGRVTGRPIHIDWQEAVAGDVSRTGGTTELAQRALDWHPQVELEDGLRAQWSAVSGSSM